MSNKLNWQNHGAVDHGSGAQVSKTIEPLWKTVTTLSGWMEPEESQPHTSVLVVTIGEDEQRGICSAALRELRNVKDQIQERGMVTICVEQRVSTLEKSKRENCATRESTEILRRNE